VSEAAPIGGMAMFICLPRKSKGEAGGSRFCELQLFRKSLSEGARGLFGCDGKGTIRAMTTRKGTASTDTEGKYL